MRYVLGKGRENSKDLKNTRNEEKGEYIYKDYMNTNNVGKFAIYCFGQIHLLWIKHNSPILLLQAEGV